MSDVISIINNQKVTNNAPHTISSTEIIVQVKQRKEGKEI